MLSLAMYFPKPEELTVALVLLAVIFLVLCACSYRMKLSVTISALAMLLGAALAIGPDLHSIWHSDNHGVGVIAREWGSTEHSDAFFAITAYMHVGRGKPLCFAGMAAGLITYAAVYAFVRSTRTKDDMRNESKLASNDQTITN